MRENKGGIKVMREKDTSYERERAKERPAVRGRMTNQIERATSRKRERAIATSHEKRETSNEREREMKTSRERKEDKPCERER